MVQVDIINYFSILFWFFLLFVINYLINYSLILPYISIRIFIYKYYLILLKLKYKSYIKFYNLYFYIRNGDNYNKYARRIFIICLWLVFYLIGWQTLNSLSNFILVLIFYISIILNMII